MSLVFEAEVAPIAEIPDAGSVRLPARITLEEAPDVRKALLRAVDKHTGSKLVLELSEVDEIDTSGAAVLAEALKVGMNRGLRVLLCSPSDSVVQIFRLAGFDDVLDHCCADPQETWRRLRA